MNLPTEVTIRAGTLPWHPHDLTMRVRYSGPLRLRFWLAATLLRFAAWLVGGRADVAREAGE